MNLDFFILKMNEKLEKNIGFAYPHSIINGMPKGNFVKWLGLEIQ
jgi:hypothetical protein